jgi:uncharacterized protein YcbK (DUF882 family)
MIQRIAWATALVMLLFTIPAAASERVHVVAPGHTLGKIAKRYLTSVEAICEANKINRRAPLKPGQRLVIPSPPGRGAVEQPSSSNQEPRTAPSKRRPGEADDADKDGAFTTHQVASGHTLGKIAQRYRTTVEAIRSANDLEPRQPLKVGTCLVVPLTRRATQRHRTQPLPCAPDKADLGTVEQARKPATTFARNPDRAGVVHLVRGGRTFRGRLIDRQGRPVPDAVQKVDGLLFDQRTSKTHTTDPGLLAKIVRVSDHFGGRRLIIVSGFREEASNPYTTRSKHALGRAIDFRVEGVPNEALRDFCHSLPGVGVGYYPNSSFIHLDVRDISTHWTDVSGPGEPPQYTSVQNPTTPSKPKSKP